MKSIEIIVAAWRPFDEAPGCGAQSAHTRAAALCRIGLPGRTTFGHEGE